MEAVAPPRRRGAFLPSLVASLGILAYLVTATALLNGIAQIGNTLLPPFEFLVPQIVRWGVEFIAVSVACLVSFWLIAPIVARLSLGAVIVRGLVASVVVFALLMPVDFALYYPIVDSEPVQIGGLYDVTGPSIDLPQVLLGAFHKALSLAVGRLPETTLAALALWWWLRRKEANDGEA